MSDDILNSHELTAVLVREIKRAWDALTAAVGDEQIYSFALYTCEEWSYLLATGNTEQGLSRAVARTADDERELNAAPDEEMLRWSYCDSE